MSSSSARIKIRKADRQDCSGILKLKIEFCTQQKSEMPSIDVADLIRDGFEIVPPYFQCLVAEMEPETEATGAKPPDHDIDADDAKMSNLVGYLLYYNAYPVWEGKSIFLEEILVHENERRKGIGLSLLRELAKVALTDDYKRIALECSKDHEPAYKLFKRAYGLDMTSAEGWQWITFSKDSISKL